MTSILKFKEKAFKEVRKSAVWLSRQTDDWLIDGCMLKLNPAKRRDFWLWPYSRLSNWIVGPLHIAWLVSPFVTPCMQFLPLLELLWLHVRPFTHSLAMFSVARYVTPGTPLWRSVDRSLFVGLWWSRIHFFGEYMSCAQMSPAHLHATCGSCISGLSLVKIEIWKSNVYRNEFPLPRRDDLSRSIAQNCEKSIFWWFFSHSSGI